MDTFPDAYDLPKLNKEAMNHLSRAKTSHKSESVIKSLSKKESLGLDGFIAEFYQTFEELISMLLKLFNKTEREEMLLNSFHEASITLTPKPDNDITKKENCRPFSMTNIDTKILNKILAN
jgi:hypothetical protein